MRREKSLRVFCGSRFLSRHTTRNEGPLLAFFQPKTLQRFVTTPRIYTCVSAVVLDTDVPVVCCSELSDDGAE